MPRSSIMIGLLWIPRQPFWHPRTLTHQRIPIHSLFITPHLGLAPTFAWRPMPLTESSRNNAACSGGSGGASTLAVALDTVLISSPTALLKFSGNNFTAILQGATTALIALNPNTTYFIQNTATLQQASFYTSTGTVVAFVASTATISSGTYTNATISGPTLFYSSGTFTTYLQVGTTFSNFTSGTMNYLAPNAIPLTFNIANSTATTSPNIATTILGTVGDAATGGVSGDGIIRTAQNLYLISGGAASSRGIKISTAGISTMYFVDGTTQTTAAQPAGNFIQNTSILQSGSTFYVSSGTANNLTVSTVVVNSLINVGSNISISSSTQQMAVTNTQATGFFIDPDSFKLTRTTGKNNCIGFYDLAANNPLGICGNTTTLTLGSKNITGGFNIGSIVIDNGAGGTSTTTINTTKLYATNLTILNNAGNPYSMNVSTTTNNFQVADSSNGPIVTYGT